MKIRIPHTVARAWDAWEEWVNTPAWIWPRAPEAARFTVRRIDVLLAIGFIGCVSWYGYTMGWRGALMGGVMYLAVMAMALWIL
jgi:hypothetical protein